MLMLFKSIAFHSLITIAAFPLLVASQAAAQHNNVPQPRELGASRSMAKIQGLQAPEAEVNAIGELGDEEVLRTLTIEPRVSKIWNPNSKLYDNVELRAYTDPDEPSNVDTPYVAPKLVTRPGQTVRLRIRNHLAPEPGCPGHEGDINVPHCFNTTNLHSHGLWVSPAGISDNVLRTLVPNKNFTYEYEYNIPADHPAGTFWYHPHVHGSTAIQVASGMAGALIIEGDRLPKETGTDDYEPGDIDVLLKDAPDSVFMLQQIQYICRNPQYPSVSKWNPDGTWRCDPGDIGKLDGYDAFTDPRPVWDRSGRFTTVNGATALPLGHKAKAGKPERWRFIHGGFADAINVSIRKMKKASSVDALRSADSKSQAEAIDRNCEHDDVNVVGQFEIAADGLTRHAILERKNTILQPGYRSDLLVVFPEPGRYCVIDEEVQNGVDGPNLARRFLFAVDVEAGASAEKYDARAQILATFTAQAMGLAAASSAVKERIIADLNDNLKLTLFAPHKTLASAKIDKIQRLYFSFGSGTLLWDPAKTPKPDHSKTTVPRGPGIGHTPNTGRRFHPNDFSRTLVLGNTDEWELHTEDPFGHPFHIHVNPFEIISVSDARGTDLTSVPTSQYFGMKGVWKDTVFVEPGVVVKARTHYRRYVGDFVLHCHILYHEDAGMMEMVRIADRDADGNPLSSGHGAAHGAVTDVPGPSKKATDKADPAQTHDHDHAPAKE
jgi:L-ascorbate oxidase